jgi:hypothetical protein
MASHYTRTWTKGVQELEVGGEGVRTIEATGEDNMETFIIYIHLPNRLDNRTTKSINSETCSMHGEFRTHKISIQKA